MCPQARKPQPFPDKKPLQFLAEPHPASVGMPLMMGGLLPWTHSSFCCQATRHVTKSFLMWTLSGSPWASSTQSGPGWGPCGLCPHMHRCRVPKFACCLRGGGAFLQQREHWPCPGISDRRSSLALTVSLYIAGSAERELGAPFKSQQGNSRLASWRGTLDGAAVAAGAIPGLGRHRGGGHCAATPVAGSGHSLLLCVIQQTTEFIP